ncbi:hypothetical protein BT96DRAFT_865766 [Gymnopus androsaceus JB14]|uniref:Uncharacterized protein n=1 Tax=Gymnopus androsaceus JB14 TaxID=1447944 RepID=A0A6A4GZ07_9AGAR|nr:hypothetical protein BT96DRAFT_865766 [Gymnopus androsaceus JB14]
MPPTISYMGLWSIPCPPSEPLGGSQLISQDHCNPQSSQAHHNWSLSQNGWIKLPNSPPNVILIPP